MTLDLRQTIREAMDASDSPDPYVIAEQVVGQIPSRSLRDVVAQLLPQQVRIMAHEQRGTAPVPADVKAGVNGKRDAGEMSQDPWRMREFVPGVGWKFSGDLTADDLEAQAEHYEQLAAQNSAHAKEKRLLADRMRRAGAAVLRELAVLEGAAA